MHGLRPTPSKVRESLFNILGDIGDVHWLDLFSGSGVMALEALSRGAASIQSVEQHRKAVSSLKSIAEDWQIKDVWRVIAKDVHKCWPHIQTPIDIIFADPPYSQMMGEQVQADALAASIDCQWLIIEESSRVSMNVLSGWQKIDIRKYGDTTLHFLQPDPHG